MIVLFKAVKEVGTVSTPSEVLTHSCDKFQSPNEGAERNDINALEKRFFGCERFELKNSVSERLCQIKEGLWEENAPPSAILETYKPVTDYHHAALQGSVRCFF